MLARMTTNVMVKYGVFVPLYNIDVSEEILDTKIFDDYVIISSKNLTERYGEYLIRGERFYEQLLQDITERHPQKSIFYPTAKYILCAEFEQEDDDTLYRNKLLISKMQISNILLAMRLTGKGFCQVNNGYYLAFGHASCLQYKGSSQLPNIERAHRTALGSLIVEDEYTLDKAALDKVSNVYQMLQSIPKRELLVPITYFHKYYDSLTPYDRILQLAIVLESTLLAGHTDELNYRLSLRSSALLNRDVTEILKLFYSVRSHIVHNGYIGENKGYKSIFKQLKNLVNIHKDDETELLYYFVTDHVEPIIREILYKSFLLFAEGKVKDYDDLNKKLDSFILKQITKDNFEVNNAE